MLLVLSGLIVIACMHGDSFQSALDALVSGGFVVTLHQLLHRQTQAMLRAPTKRASDVMENIRIYALVCLQKLLAAQPALAGHITTGWFDDRSVSHGILTASVEHKECASFLPSLCILLSCSTSVTMITLTLHVLIRLFINHAVNRNDARGAPLEARSPIAASSAAVSVTSAVEATHAVTCRCCAWTSCRVIVSAFDRATPGLLSSLLPLELSAELTRRSEPVDVTTSCSECLLSPALASALHEVLTGVERAVQPDSSAMTMLSGVPPSSAASVGNSQANGSMDASLDTIDAATPSSRHVKGSKPSADKNRPPLQQLWGKYVAQRRRLFTESTEVQQLLQQCLSLLVQ